MRLEIPVHFVWWYGEWCFLIMILLNLPYLSLKGSMYNEGTFFLSSVIVPPIKCKNWQQNRNNTDFKSVLEWGFKYSYRKVLYNFLNLCKNSGFKDYLLHFRIPELDILYWFAAALFVGGGYIGKSGFWNALAYSVVVVNCEAFGTHSGTFHHRYRKKWKKIYLS